MNQERMVSVEDVWKTYRMGGTEIPALQGVSFELEPGGFTAVVGKSGCGKSTLLHLLGGLDTPDKGRIRIGGEDLADQPERTLCRLRRRQLGFVFQSYNLIPELTARENIIFPSLLEKKAVDDAYLERLAELLELKDRLGHLPGQMSGGQQQRVAVARALILKPALVLMDEPTGNLDSASSQQMIAGLRGIQKELGQTILIVTHDGELAATADRTLRMSDGKLVDA